MRIAKNADNQRVSIEDAHNDEAYYCQSCGAPLVINRGKIRAHYFSHKPGTTKKRNDTWERNNFYCTSEWHTNWQNMFPKNNQEIVINLGEVCHRADIMIDTNVIEFQHSNITQKHFEERNNFYINQANYRVIWVFDLRQEAKNKNLSYVRKDEDIIFSWKNPSRAFNTININNSNHNFYNIELFFEIGNSEKPLVKVTDQKHGYEKFKVEKFISKKEFLEYIGFKNNYCPLPDLTNILDRKKYKKFKEKYNINLSKTQERAVQAVNGSVLLLAVPGSGKTHVLTIRLGYMVLFKHIDPNRILALSFTRAASQEIKKRYISTFGEETGKNIDFRTINSLATEIISNKDINQSIISQKEKNKIIRNLCKEIYDKTYVYEHEIIEIEQSISYAKNSMKSEENFSYQFYYFYQKYCEELRQRKLMDFDDQLIFAYNELKNNSESLKCWHNRYDYILVDEAQDTSKIQHEILKLLAKGNNIFMVGDEDQSIYGFRSADPSMLLNFRYNYLNPFIMMMETNYRSTPEITNFSQKFISKFSGRYPKQMVSNREHGAPVQLKKVKTRQQQYDYLIESAKDRAVQTAFLYRNNESSIVLVDKLLRANIPFEFVSKTKLDFFNYQTVQQIIAYLSISIDDSNHNVLNLNKIINKGILFLNENQKNHLFNNLKNSSKPIMYELENQKAYTKHNEKDGISAFIDLINSIKNINPCQAIEKIMDCGYRKYLVSHSLSQYAVESLELIAKDEDTVSAFIKRIEYLKQVINFPQLSMDSNPILLSTIHASKGLEYNSVYMVDIFDGNLPSNKPIFSNYINPYTNEFDKNCKDGNNPYEEERRIFYVGMTRTKNNLCLIKIENEKTSFINECFNLTEDKMTNIAKSNFKNNHLKSSDEIKKSKQEAVSKYIEPFINYELMKNIDSLKYYEEIDDLKTKRIIEQKFSNVLNSKSHFRDKIIDQNGIWWKICENCRKIKPADKFADDFNDPVFGICLECKK